MITSLNAKEHLTIYS